MAGPNPGVFSDEKPTAAEALADLHDKFGDSTTFGGFFQNAPSGNVQTQAPAEETVTTKETSTPKPEGEIPPWVETLTTASQVENQRMRDEIKRLAQAQQPGQAAAAPESPRYTLNPDDQIQGKHLKAVMDHYEGALGQVREQAQTARFWSAYEATRAKYPEFAISNNDAQNFFEQNKHQAGNMQWPVVLEAVHKAMMYDKLKADNSKLQEMIKKHESKLEAKTNRQQVPQASTVGNAASSGEILRNTYAPDMFQSGQAGKARKPRTIAELASQMRRMYV